MSYTVNEINYDYNSNTNQRIKEKFVGREVYSLVNGMVEYILSKSWDDPNAPFSYDDVTNFYKPQCSECDSTDGFEEIENDETEETEFKCCSCGHVFEEIDSLDTEAQEVYQWFMVSSFLANKLRDKGECIIEGEDIWGRGCCGQAILLDHVISEICYDMEILEGQKYEWSVV